MVCFKCGRMSHNEDTCPTTASLSNNEVMELNEQLQDTTISSNSLVMKQHVKNPEENETFGSWMLVKKPVRKRGPRVEKNNQEGGNNPTRATTAAGKNPAYMPNQGNKSHATNQGEKRGTGSRFSVLENPINANIGDIGKSQENNIFAKDIILEGESSGAIKDSNIFPTVELGDNSLEIPNPPRITPIFNLGIHTFGKQNPSAHIPINRSTQDKHEFPSGSTKAVLTESNNNIVPRILTKAHRITNRNLGKENYSINQSQSQLAASVTEQNSPHKLNPSQQIATHSTTHGPVPNHTDSPPGEDLVLRTVNGRPLPSGCDPPDPHIGGTNGDMDRTEPGTTGIGSDNATTQ